MNVLIACEESQTVLIEFLKRGHNAFSNDLSVPSGDMPERHILADCRDLLNIPANGLTFITMDGKVHLIYKWDLIIAHPPCTYLSNVATKFHSLKSSILESINDRTLKRIDAARLFMDIATANCEKIAIENPVGIMSTVYRKPDQIIHPYYFAESVDDEETTI